MSEKPTDKARSQFGMAQSQAKHAHMISMKKKDESGRYDSHVAVSLFDIAAGLEAVATGMRATYILLEEIKRALEHKH